MANLVTVEANSLLAASSAQTTYPAPTGALKIALNTAVGTATAAGTEVTGGSYARQTVTYAAASAGSIASNLACTYTLMPSCTVTSIDEFDSAGTPIRRWFGLLAASKVVNSGDTFSLAIGAVTKTLA